jgi:hypothetical protein
VLLKTSLHIIIKSQKYYFYHYLSISFLFQIPKTVVCVDGRLFKVFTGCIVGIGLGVGVGGGGTMQMSLPSASVDDTRDI